MGSANLIGREVLRPVRQPATAEKDDRMASHTIVDNWQTVGQVIRERMNRLGISQAQLIVRSGLSKATVFELQYCVNVRHRSPRTLAAISTALDLHHDYLEAIACGEVPPSLPEPKRKAAIKVDKFDQIEIRLRNVERLLIDLSRRMTG